jgi:hypothetical protein
MTLQDLLPGIMEKEVSSRIAQIKNNTSMGPDGILQKDIITLEMQEILDLLCYLSRFATTNHWHIGKTE